MSLESYKEALRRINECKTYNKSSLQIFELGIVVIPEEIQQLTQLKELYISSNRINNIDILSKLTNLQVLSLHSNQISDISALSSLSQLQKLSLTNNQVENINSLTYLQLLQELELAKNSISDLTALSTLTHLRRLYLNENKITDISPLASLKQLNVLSLGQNKISDIKTISYLNQLISLNLIDNQVDDISPLLNLTQLNFLSLYGNRITDLQPLAQLYQIKRLYLGDNNIRDLNPLNNLIKIESLSINKNNIEILPNFLLKLNLPFKASIDTFNEIVVGSNPWKHPPIEILLKGSESIQAYFDSLENKQARPLNEVKVIIVGEGASGKTSLMRQLRNQNFNAHQPQTHGILIERSEFVCDGEPVQVHFWDFGGQEIMHATHQFFLTERSIYVLLLDSRKEDQTEYWLKHIEAFGKQSPVLVVINKIDENPGFDLNRPFLNEKYPFIANRFFRISCKRGDGISEFQDALQTVIQDMDIRKQPFSPNWLAVKQTLSTMQRDYITYEEFQQQCEADDVTDENQQKTILSFLNDLGIVFEHKRQSDRFGTFIMNPQWLTRAVYGIINAPEVADKNGFLVWDDLESILHKPEDTAADPDQRRKELRASYPSSKFAFIVGMLQQFELCYKVENEDRWMIPDLLPVSRKDIPIDFTGAAHYLFVYDFLPNSVLPTLMVQLSRWIVQDLQWRTGVVLKDLSSESYAYIEADKEAKTIAIRVKSEGANFQRSFLNLIRQTLQDINKKLNITIEEKVALPDVPNEYVSYQELIDHQELGERQIIKLKRRYIINDLLEGVDATNRISNPTRTQIVNIFISYSHKDTTYKEELITALYPLIRQDKIQVWQDGEIVAGQRWNDEIMGHLEQAHIVITLMSPDFIRSDFCYSIELSNALKAEERGEKTIIPIQIRPCAWHDLPIGAIQGIPTHPIADYPNHDTGWMEVYKGVKRALNIWQARQNLQKLRDM